MTPTATSIQDSSETSSDLLRGLSAEPVLWQDRERGAGMLGRIRFAYGGDPNDSAEVRWPCLMTAWLGQTSAATDDDSLTSPTRLANLRDPDLVRVLRRLTTVIDIAARDPDLHTISDIAARRARLLIFGLWNQFLGTPPNDFLTTTFVTVGADGSVSFEWHKNALDLYVYIESDGAISVVVDHGDNAPDEFSVDSVIQGAEVIEAAWVRTT